MTDFIPTPPDRLPLAPSPESERLRQELHVERRSYLEEVEDAVAETAAASTPLDMRLMQLGNRSVEVTVEVADRQIRGRIVHVSGEIATIQNIGGAMFCVRIASMMSLRHLNQPGETRGVETGSPSTIVAKVREAWTLGQRCTIGRQVGNAVLGDITAVTDGHIECLDPQGTHWLIPIDTISWIGPKL